MSLSSSLAVGMAEVARTTAIAGTIKRVARERDAAQARADANYKACEAWKLRAQSLERYAAQLEEYVALLKAQR